MEETDLISAREAQKRTEEVINLKKRFGTEKILRDLRTLILDSIDKGRFSCIFILKNDFNKWEVSHFLDSLGYKFHYHNDDTSITVIWG